MGSLEPLLGDLPPQKVRTVGRVYVQSCHSNEDKKELTIKNVDQRKSSFQIDGVLSP